MLRNIRARASEIVIFLEFDKNFFIFYSDFLDFPEFPYNFLFFSQISFKCLKYFEFLENFLRRPNFLRIPPKKGNFLESRSTDIWFESLWFYRWMCPSNSHRRLFSRSACFLIQIYVREVAPPPLVANNVKHFNVALLFIHPFGFLTAKC